MKVDQIVNALHASPFVPFRIVLPSDRAVPVPHPEFASVAPNRRCVLVWDAQGTSRFIDPSLIAELNFDPTPA